MRYLLLFACVCLGGCGMDNLNEDAPLVQVKADQAIIQVAQGQESEPESLSADYVFGVSEAEESWMQYTMNSAEKMITDGRYCEAASQAELMLGKGDTCRVLQIGKAIYKKNGDVRIFRAMINWAQEHEISFNPRFEGPLSPNHGRDLAEAIKCLGCSRNPEDQKLFCHILKASEQPIFVYLDGWDCLTIEVNLEQVGKMSRKCQKAALTKAWAEWVLAQNNVSADELPSLVHEPCGGNYPDGTTPAFWLEKVMAVKVPKPATA